jgi:membrane fusion protein (multidrug efflux system)
VITVAPETLAVRVDRHADGFVNAQIRPQVSGYLLTRDYAEGARSKGEVLFEVDRRPFRQRLQANAQLASQAQLGKTNLQDKPLASSAIAQTSDNVQANLAARAQPVGDRRRRQRAAQSRLHACDVAHRRGRGDCHGADRRSRRAGDAPDHRLE